MRQISSTPPCGAHLLLYVYMKHPAVIVLGTALALAVCLGIWQFWWSIQNTMTGIPTLPMASARTVANVSCSGSCEKVTVTSDQEPGRVYLENTAFDSCIPVTLWANRMREEQIGVNGYAFDQGGQINLRPITVDASSGEQIAVRMVMADAVPEWYEQTLPAVFSFIVKDEGDWNMIDAESFVVEHGEGMSVSTEYLSGSVTLYDGCSENAKNLVTYTLYQSPELAWPGSEQTYLVFLVRRGTYGASEESADVKIFERVYTQGELEAEAITVEAVDGDVTLTFDLVKE